MAIIYSYPTKENLVEGDLLLITDSASTTPKNQTSQTSLKSLNTYLKEALGVVDSLSAGSGISVSAATGDITIGNTGVLSLTATLPLQRDTSTGSVTISSRAYGGGSTTGYVPSGGSVGQYLGGDGNWATASTGTVTGTGTIAEFSFFNSTSSIASTDLLTIGSSRLYIKDYIYHKDNSTGNTAFFGFNTDNEFLVYLDTGAQERLQLKDDFFAAYTGVTPKISAGATYASLAHELVTAAPSPMQSASTLITTERGFKVSTTYKSTVANSDLGFGGQIQFAASQDAGKYVGLMGPISSELTSNYNLMLPNAPGTSGQILACGSTPFGTSPNQFRKLEWTDPTTSTGTANTVPLFSAASAIGNSIITQPTSQQVTISSTSNSAPATLQLPISTSSGPNPTLGGVNIYGGLYNVALPNISPATSTGIIQFGSATSGQSFDFRNNKIAFDTDSTNTFIKADSSNPESLEIHADKDIQLRPDGYVVIYQGGPAPTTASDSGDQGTIVYDDNYLYICVQDDVWKRAALSTW